MLVELKDQLDQSRAQLHQLNEQYVRTCTLKDELTQQLQQDQQNHHRLHAMIKNAETRAQAAQHQLQQLIAKERELVNEKKLLRKS
jgi:hypothetical protein